MPDYSTKGPPPIPAIPYRLGGPPEEKIEEQESMKEAAKHRRPWDYDRPASASSRTMRRPRSLSPTEAGKDVRRREKIVKRQHVDPIVFSRAIRMRDPDDEMPIGASASTWQW